MLTSNINRFKLYEGLDNSSLRTIKLWENAGVKLKEAALTPDQISQLFAAAEQGATAGGANRTVLGKGKDAAVAVNNAWKNLKGKIYSSGPMQNFATAYDQAAEKLKQATGGDAGAMKYVQKYRDFSTKHPIIQKFIYAALIAAAGISSAGLGGAAALALLKTADKALQGEDIRSAIWAGAKTGALAYGASQLKDFLTDLPDQATVSGQQNATAAVGKPTPDFFNVDMVQSKKAMIDDLAGRMGLPPGEHNLTGGSTIFKATHIDGIPIPKNLQSPEEVARRVLWVNGGEDPGPLQAVKFKVGDIAQDGSQYYGKGDTMGDNPRSLFGPKGMSPEQALKYFKQSTIDNSQEISRWEPISESRKHNLIDRDLTFRMWQLHESMGKRTRGVYLSESGVQTLFLIAEGAGWDTFKKGIGQVGSGIKQGAQAVGGQAIAAVKKTGSEVAQLAKKDIDAAKQAGGKILGKAYSAAQITGQNLTNKVTADKLNKAWKKAGSPLDSDRIKDIMQKAGLTPEIITKSFKDLGIAAGAVSPAGSTSNATSNIAAGAKAASKGAMAAGKLLGKGAMTAGKLLGKGASAAGGALANAAAKNAAAKAARASVAPAPATPATPAAPATPATPAAASAPIPGTKAFQAARRR